MATSSKDDYDPILAGDIVQATKAKQRSFDATNTPAQYLPKPDQAAPAAAPSPAGPVGRATQQLASQPTPRPMSLADAAPRQTSFDATNTPEKYMPASQSAGQGLAAASAAPGSRQPNLRDAFPTSIGDGRSAIYGGIGANGEASFSNTASTLNSVDTNFTAPNSPPAQGMTSLSQAWQLRPAQPAEAPQRLDLANAYPDRSRQTAGQEPTLASMGSVRNMGDGIGSFSQAESGDAALAATRFQRASDLRNGYADQDRLKIALARQEQDRNFNVIGDSGRSSLGPRLDRQREAKDQRFALERGLHSRSLADAVDIAQSAVDDRREGRITDGQQRQAARLEDIMTAGTAPNATLLQQQALQRALDPDGSKALSRQQTLANIDKTTAEADKARREASATGVKLTESQSKDLNYFGRGNSSNDRLEDQSSALTASASGDRSAFRGLADAAIRGIPFVGDSSLANSLVSKERQQAEQSGREFVSAILRKDSGAAITNQEMETYGKMFLAQPGDSEQVLAQKHESRVTALQGIRDGLGTAEILAAPLGRPAERPNRPQQQPAQNTQTAPAQTPIYRISTEEQFARLPSGANFIDPQGNHRRKP
ncbi:hypothetical protein NVV30_21075 [Pseudomonas syringae]|uniref:hypothetical protein n=1 Tax=Pseudomonas syringae TaxID=317 RepID=UPI00215B3D7F|nr:hypothetical protein [Pseudomonas syringae]MCR8721173.1 hypothetical protein [Pseudomonas syringae]